MLVQENVLVQLEHLRTHPAVATAMAAGDLKLHAWVYKMETGDVYAYDPDSGQFSPLRPGEQPTPVYTPRPTLDTEMAAKPA